VSGAAAQIVVDVDMTPQQVAERLQVDYHSVLRAIRAGRLMAFRPFGPRGPIRVRQVDFQAWAYGTPAAVTDAPPPVEKSSSPRPRERGRLVPLATRRGAA
jgi:excisionase family DNA binding protein